MILFPDKRRQARNMNQVRFFRLAIFLWIVSWFCYFLVPPSLCGASDSLPVEKILEGIKNRYSSADFEADFVQESHLGAMGIVDTAQGHVYFKPPAMMRWCYDSPEEYLITTDGRSLWIYRPEEDQVMMGRAADYFGDTKWAEFFTEPGRLLDDFSVQLTAADLQEEGRYVLKLIPIKPHPNVAQILLYVSRGTFDVVQSVTYNSLGDKTTLRFDGFRFNQGLDPSFFAFTIPRGTDVLQLGESKINFW